MLVSEMWEALYSGIIIIRRKKSLGDWSDGGIPGLISNPEVKPVSADGTWGVAPWESRSLPRDFFLFYMFFRFAISLTSGYNGFS